MKRLFDNSFGFSFTHKNRAKFLNNTLKWSNHLNKQDAIGVFQLIGRHYSSLTNMVNQINYCYAFQVRWSISFFEWTAIDFFHLHIFLATLGDDNHWKYFREFGFYCLFISYSYHRNAFRDEQPFKLAHWLLTSWLIYFLFITLITIHVSVSVTNEVCILASSVRFR